MNFGLKINFYLIDKQLYKHKLFSAWQKIQKLSVKSFIFYVRIFNNFYKKYDSMVDISECNCDEMMLLKLAIYRYTA